MISSTEKNNKINEVWHYITNTFRVVGNKVVNPFFFSSEDDWEIKDIRYQTDRAEKLVKTKNMLYWRRLSFIKEDIFIIDKNFEVSYIDPDYLKDFFDDMWMSWANEEEDKDVLREFIIDFGKEFRQDQQIQILHSFIKNFKVYKWWYIRPIEAMIYDKHDWEITDQEKYDRIRFLLQQDFKTYAANIEQFSKEDVDLVVMADVSAKKYYNEDLPTPQVPLVLRKILEDKEWNKFSPYYRQMYYEYNMTDFNIVITTRQAGKTFYSISDGIAKIMTPWKNDVTYVVKNESVLYQPREYLKALWWIWDKIKIFNIRETKWEIQCSLTGNTMSIVSSESKMGARSRSSKHFIIDEWSFIKTDFFLDILPIIRRNKSTLSIYSTINRKMRKEQTEFVFDKMLDIMFWKENWLVLRVTIDDIHEYDPIEREKAKKDLEKYPDRYYTELYATMPPKDSELISQWFFVSKKVVDVDWKPPRYIIWRDPAKKWDFWWVVILRQECWTIVYEKRLAQMMYSDQINFIKDLKKSWNALVVMDQTGNEWLAEMTHKEKLVDFYIHYTSWSSRRTEMYQWRRVYYVPKYILVDNFTVLSEQWKLFALVQNIIIQQEIESFAITKTSSGNLKFWAATWYDDVLNAWFIASFIYKITYLDPLERNLEYEKSQKEHKMNQEWLKRYWLSQPKNKIKQRYKKFTY